MGILGIWICLFLIYTGLVIIVQFQSPLYYLWGMRNNFRYYAAFLAIAAFLDRRDAENYFNLLDKFFWLNIVITVYQFFALELKGDQLGGIFGVEAGSNGYTNIFFLIVLTRSIIFCLEKRESLGSCFVKCAAALVVAAMAELKFFYIEFVLVIILAVLLTGFTWRKLAVIVGGILGTVLCVALLISIFPQYVDWFNIQAILESATSDKGYTSSGDLNRLTAIGQINELWLTDTWSRVFGLGLGNCDTSAYALINTPFFEANGDMHYTWISYAMMYLETGWIGLIFYWGFFTLVYILLIRIEKRSDAIAGLYIRMAKIITILCIVFSLYNSSLRAESGYMAYAILAVPFAMNRDAVRRYSGC